MRRDELEEALSVAKHKSEGNSPDFRGGGEREKDVESLHAWAELSAQLGSKLVEGFYIERHDALAVTRTENGEGVRFDVYPAKAVGSELAERLRNAERELKDLSVDAAVAGRDSEAARLANKAAGVSLALSYVLEMTRG